MAWNRPSTTTSQPKKERHLLRIPLVLFSLIALVVAVKFLIPTTVSTSKQMSPQGAMHSNVVSAVQEKVSAPTNQLSCKTEEPVRTQQTNQTRVAKHSGRFVDISKAVKIPRHDPPKRFNHPAEEAIASILEIEPGSTLVGDIDYTKKNKFANSFKESLAQPTPVKDDDSPYVRELKESVQQVKMDLKARMEAGEDVGKIMNDSRRELQELGLYRMELMKELDKVRKDGKTSSEEYEDFVKAANMMLEKKGAKKISIPRTVYKQFKLRERRLRK